MQGRITFANAFNQWRTSMSNIITAQVAHTPIIHNGKHYNVGDTLKLPENEFIELQYYLQKTGETASLAGAIDEQIQAEAAAIADEIEQAQAEQTQAEQAETQTTKTTRAKK